MRESHKDKSVAERNAHVLREIGDVPTHTKFYQQLELLRKERATKCLGLGPSPSSPIALYIPGRIIHLSDINLKGDNSKYVAYWASRYDFRLVISQRMKSDHSMLDLIEVLEDIQLEGSNWHDKSSMISAVLNSSINTSEVDEGGKDNCDDEHGIFMCCSNPDGAMPMFLVAITVVALILSIRGVTRCTFFTRDSYLMFDEKKLDDSSFLPFSIGLYSYTLLTCENENCTGAASGNLVPTEYCLPYPDPKEGWGMTAARGFALLVVIFGGFSLLLLCISTCFPLKRRTWKLISCLLLLTTLFQGLVFLAKQSTLCTPNKADADGDIMIYSSCQVGKGGIEAIIALCLFFITAVLTMCFVRAKRRH